MTLSVTECIKAVYKQLQDEDIALKDADRAEILHQIEKLAESSAQGMPVTLETLANLTEMARNRSLAYSYAKRKHTEFLKKKRLQTKLHASSAEGQARSLIEAAAILADTATPNPLHVPTEKRMFSDVQAARKRTHDLLMGYKKTHPHIDLYTDTEKMRSVLLYMVGKDGQDIALKPLADDLRAQLDELHYREKDAGSTEGYTPNYLPRDTDVSKVVDPTTRLMTDERAQFLLDNLDPAWHPDLEVSAVALHNGEVSQLHNDFDPSGSTGTGSRKMHLKTVEAEIENMLRFGKYDPLSMITRSIERKTRAVVMHEDWSQSPIATMEQLFGEALDEAQANLGADVNAGARVEALRKAALRRVEAYRGEGAEMQSTRVAQVEGLLMAANNVSTLGRVLASQMFDLVNTSVNNIELGGHGVHRNLDGLLSNNQHIPDAAKLEAFKQQDILSGVFNGSVAHRFVPAASYAGSEAGLRTVNAAGRVTQLLQRGTSLLMRLGPDQLNDELLRRVWNAHTSMMADAALDGIRYKDLQGWNPEFALRLKEAGIGEATFNAVVHNDHVVGHEASGYRTIDFSKVQNKRALSEMMAYIGHEAQFGVSRPDLMSRQFAHQLQDNGSVKGMAWRIGMQYQAMQLSVIRHTMLRAYRRGPTTMAKMFLPLLVVGVAKMQFDQWANNQPMYKWDSSLLYTGAIDRANIFGLVGAIGHSANEARVIKGEWNPYSLLENTSGPLSGQIVKGTKIASQAAFGADTATSDARLKREAAELAFTLVPGRNALPLAHWVPMLMGEYYDSIYTPPAGQVRQQQARRGLNP